MKRFVVILSLAVASTLSNLYAKESVWILTDMSDKSIVGGNKEGTVNDPDDISAMAGYLLLANEFETRGITVASTHRKELATTPNQADWCVEYFGAAYKSDLKALSKGVEGYPRGLSLGQQRWYIPIYESSIKVSAERFAPKKSYDIDDYPSIRVLYDELRSGPSYTPSAPLNLLCWGSLTEAAILAQYCILNGEAELLHRLRIIAHWTASPLHQGTVECPECVANCKEDGVACRYLKELASQSRIRYYECGAIGQHGIVSGSQRGAEYYEQFKGSRLGEIFATGKFVFNGVDDSDSATYYVLLGRWGVTLDDIASDGSNGADVELRNEKQFKAEAMNMREELLRRCRLVGVKGNY